VETSTRRRAANLVWLSLVALRNCLIMAASTWNFRDGARSTLRPVARIPRTARHGGEIACCACRTQCIAQRSALGLDRCRALRGDQVAMRTDEPTRQFAAVRSVGILGEGAADARIVRPAAEPDSGSATCNNQP